MADKPQLKLVGTERPEEEPTRERIPTIKIWNRIVKEALRRAGVVS